MNTDIQRIIAKAEDLGFRVSEDSNFLALTKIVSDFGISLELQIEEFEGIYITRATDLNYGDVLRQNLTFEQIMEYLEITSLAVDQLKKDVMKYINTINL